VAHCRDFLGGCDVNMKRTLLAQITLGLIFSAAVFAPPSLAPTAAEIDQSVSTALRDLNAHNDAARALGAEAKAILVFPDIKKGAFIVGASCATHSRRATLRTGKRGGLLGSHPPHRRRGR
jgi:hypothetical protein